MVASAVDDDASTTWHSHPVVRRDRERFGATCGEAVLPSVRPVESLARVLVVDGRCVCKNNGIGNLYGDYVTWFLIAALTNRRIFFNWKDTLALTNETKVRNLDEAACLSVAVGGTCGRVHARFDLGAHFVAQGGNSWRWTPRTRKQVADFHGGAMPAQALMLAGTPHNTLPHERGDVTAVARAAAATGGRANWTCVELWQELQSKTPMVNVRFSEGGSTGLLPRCMRGPQDPPRRPKGTTSVLFPTPAVLGKLAHEAVKRARAAGASTVVVKNFRLEAQAVEAGRLGLFHSLPLVAAGVDTHRRRDDHGQLARLMRCLTHAALQPRRSLRRQLWPTLRRVGSRALVTVQARSGWADDVQEAPGTPHVLSQLVAEIGRFPRHANAHGNYRELFSRALLHGNATAIGQLDQAVAQLRLGGRAPRARRRESRSSGGSGGGSDGSSGGAASCDRSCAAPAELHHLLLPPAELTAAGGGGGGGADGERRATEDLARRRWALLASDPCLQSARRVPAQKRRVLEILNRHDPLCFGPSSQLGEGPLAAFGTAAWQRHAGRPFSLPGAATSRLIAALQCAARVGQSVAADRAALAESQARGKGGGDTASAGAGGGAGGGGDAWALYVSSDSPGLRALLAAHPSLRGHVVACGAEGCGAVEATPGTWRFPSTREATELAADLWLLAAAEHTLALARTTFVYWAARGGFGGGGRAQFVGRHIPPAGDKQMPLCGPSWEGCVDLKPNYNRGTLHGRVSNGSACFARRYALLSPVAARSLEAPFATAAELRAVAATVAQQAGKVVQRAHQAQAEREQREAEQRQSRKAKGKGKGKGPDYRRRDAELEAWRDKNKMRNRGATRYR